jgi:predicted TIM-barrel fold metal-dependent hydrolase
VGIRHIVQSEPDDRFLLQPDFLHGISVLEEFDRVYDILMYTRHLQVAAKFVKRFPRQRFVLDHIAKPPIRNGNIDSWVQGIFRLAAFPNVFCKLTGLVTEAHCSTGYAADRPLPQRCLRIIRTGPADDRIELARMLAGGILRANDSRGEELSPSDKIGSRDRVLGGNAQRFWRLGAN